MVTDNSDEAMSLAEYLNQHGFRSKIRTKRNHLSHRRSATAATIYSLRKTWKGFWEHSTPVSFGLPCLIGPASDLRERRLTPVVFGIFLPKR